MTRFRPGVLNAVVPICAALAFSAPGCDHQGANELEIARVVRENTRPSLVGFAGDAELRAYVDDLSRAREEHRQRSRASAQAMPAPCVAESAAPEESEPAADESGADESITNVQEAGVDEGGIVKTHGEHLVVLRRGRLFSIDLSGGQMRPVSMVNAFPPGANGGGWYDEMLINGDTIVVIGYSYDANATELGLFSIDASARITHRATYFLQSSDYYSSRNYASRLVGDTLVFYMPYNFLQERWVGNRSRLEMSLPGVRAFDAGGRNDWDQIMTSTDIYRPIQPDGYPVLHTVVTCDLAAAQMSCRARGIIGPSSRTFYVSSRAVYVWVSGSYRYPEGSGVEPGQEQVSGPGAVVYRMPLDGGPLGALRASGAPVDQFSFKEGDDGFLNVLVRADGGGDAMWAPEVSSGDMALLRVPVAEISPNVGRAQTAAFTPLPRPEGYEFQNRFVGDYLLYGTGSGWGYASEQAAGAPVFVHPYRTGGQTARLQLPHGVDRIEAMGAAAVVIGTDGQNLHFTAIELDADPAIAGEYVQQGASQGELRSHGFFFKPDGPTSGTLGLPVRSEGSAGAEHLVNGSAQVVFLHVERAEGAPSYLFSQVGALAARDTGAVDDQCVASCVDWYGNARPIFYRGRVYALLGYELVEGRIDQGQMVEAGRANFLAPLLAGAR